MRRSNITLVAERPKRSEATRRSNRRFAPRQALLPTSHSNSPNRHLFPIQSAPVIERRVHRNRSAHERGRLLQRHAIRYLDDEIFVDRMTATVASTRFSFLFFSVSFDSSRSRATRIGDASQREEFCDDSLQDVDCDASLRSLTWLPGTLPYLPLTPP